MDKHRRLAHYASTVGGLALVALGLVVFTWATHVGRGGEHQALLGSLAAVSSIMEVTGFRLLIMTVRRRRVDRAAQRSAGMAPAERPVSAETSRYVISGIAVLLLALFVPVALQVLFASWDLSLPYVSELVGLSLLGWAALLFYDGFRGSRP